MKSYLPPILTFHDISGASSVISFPPASFRRGLAKLHAHGYRTLSLADTAERLREKRAFPERSFVITFDDGYDSVYENAFPVLQEFAMTATVFLPVGEVPVAGLDQRLPTLEGRAMLSWRRIGEMHEHGIDFGGHTATHADLTSLHLDRAEKEIVTSKDVIAQQLGGPVPTFAYPFGRFNPTIRDLVERHFSCACADTLGLLKPTSDVHALERVDAYYLRDPRCFDLMATAWFPSYVKARAFPRRVRRMFQSVANHS